MRGWLLSAHSRPSQPLRLTADVSGVPCGCLACIYLVAMKDPEGNDPMYCDMAENVKPGYGGGTCTELDMLEARRRRVVPLLPHR